MLVEVNTFQSSPILERIQILNAIADNFGLMIVPLVAPASLPDSQVGPYGEKMLLEGKADLIARPWQKTKRQAELFDFSERVYFANTRFIRGKTVQQFDQLWSFFHTYDVWVWAAIGVVWIAQFVACAVIFKAEATILRGRRRGLAACAWQTLRILLQQSASFAFKCRAGKFSLMLFSLLQYAILGIYSSFVLLAIIRRPSPEPLDVGAVIRHLERGEYRFVTPRPKFVNEVLNKADTFPFLQLRKALQSNPMLVVKNAADVRSSLRTQRGITLQINDLDFFPTGPNCEFTVMGDDFPVAPAFFVLKKGSRWTAAINRALRFTRTQIDNIVGRYSAYARKYTSCAEPTADQPLRSFDPKKF
ncbi:hypothetical protein M3Y99_01632700 [Aphelenchoides fujianensis]|nr:hypothetical protein M3Y99_01632700 [Aphelenchoides fujianensis]